MEAVHQCSAQGLQFTPAQEHSPEHQECCLKTALAGADVCREEGLPAKRALHTS